MESVSERTRKTPVRPLQVLENSGADKLIRIVFRNQEEPTSALRVLLAQGPLDFLE